MIPSSLLAWVAFGGLTITFFVEIVVNYLEFIHLSLSPLSTYTKTTHYVVHQYRLDSFRFTMFKLLWSYLFYCLFIASMGKIWSVTGGNVMFLVLASLLQAIFLTLPLEAVSKCFVASKYNAGEAFVAVFLSVVGDWFDTLFSEMILLGIVYLVARCTNLDPLPTETAQEEQAAAAAQEEREEPRRGCCDGKFWLILTGVLVVFVVAVNLSVVELFEAMYGADKFKRLAESNVSMRNETTEYLKQSMKELMDRNGFPYEDVYIFTTSESPNAMFLGVRTQRIVIYTSLLPLVNVRQLCAVVGHELGHWKHKDTIVMFVVVVVLALFAGAVLKLVTHVGLSAFGFPDGRRPVVAVLILTEVVLVSFAWLWKPAQNLLSRTNEYAADCFAAQQGYPIAEALRAITKTVSSEIEYTWLYEVFYLDHPQLSKREQNVKKCVSK